jgi:sugar lactone lactonase YvrE
MAIVHVAVDARAQLGEGPVWDDRRQRLYWVDILGGLVHVHDPEGAPDRATDVGVHVGAVAMRQDGTLLLAVADGFRLLDPDRGEQHPFTSIEHTGPPARFNDGKCDPFGNFWAGTMTYGELPGAAVLYRLDRNGGATAVLDGVTISNGLDFSADGRTMYYIDTPLQRIDAFDVDAESRALSNRRTVVEIDAARGAPDGMTLDREGGIWVALWDGAAVHRYTTDGDLSDVVALPVRRPTCPVFGGADLDVLYVTSASIGTNDPLAGAVLAIETGARGRLALRYGG